MQAKKAFDRESVLQNPIRRSRSKIWRSDSFDPRHFDKGALGFGVRGKQVAASSRWCGALLGLGQARFSPEVAKRRCQRTVPGRRKQVRAGLRFQVLLDRFERIFLIPARWRGFEVARALGLHPPFA